MQRFNNTHYNRDGSIKIGYKTPHEAWRICQEIALKKPVVMGFYFCQKCNKWHIGVKKIETNNYS